MRKIFTGMVATLVLSWTPFASATFLFGNSSDAGTQQLIINGGTIFDTSASPFDAGVDNQGWWSPTSNNNDSNDNYIVRDTILNNNFFTFDLANFQGGANSAQLVLTRFSTQGPLPTLYSLFDVTTPVDVLNNNVGSSQAIYDDLGSGISYGSLLVTDFSLPNPLVVTLNANALAAINRSAGGFFSIGGTLAPSDPPQNVPEPMPLALMGLALAALGWSRKLPRR